ncbi:TAP-like protein-domain-containing protein [Mycena pura]|uniref:TAP-like protein-domain-containing protein n=1 Tax=Mycena pura TaxID=153505 RepID=A0AAD6Y5G4_9AGAR|nr:TAP-like protein-domain-containing protein [Mycena pura]
MTALVFSLGIVILRVFYEQRPSFQQLVIVDCANSSTGTDSEPKERLLLVIGLVFRQRMMRRRLLSPVATTRVPGTVEQAWKQGRQARSASASMSRVAGIELAMDDEMTRVAECMLLVHTFACRSQDSVMMRDASPSPDYLMLGPGGASSLNDMLSSTTLLLLSGLLFPIVVIGQASDTFPWNQLTPSTDLHWVDCNSIFQCARLEVPLDYSDPGAGSAALAVIRLPANVSQEDYRGPLLWNPGGPATSGVDSLVGIAQSFQVILGKQYDYVSFDLRGLGSSTPGASFFASDAERAVWNAAAPPTLNASSDAIQQHWGRAQLLGQLAAQRDKSGILKYMTTDNVARDMLLITQKFGFEQLQYYGISYGSVLGATFAALFPDKVGRIIIDGVVDADAWYNANLTIEASETDAVLQAFFDSCVAAGPTLCAFYEPTAAQIADRLAALTASVRAKPVPVITPASYGLVDYSLLRTTLFGSFRFPYSTWPTLARGLAALEGGDGTALFAMSAEPPFQCDCTGGTNSTAPNSGNLNDAGTAFKCGDTVEVMDTIDELTEFYENIAKISQFAEFTAVERASCEGWKVHREGRFLGPVSAANTSFPLLLVTTSADPLAPKEGALKTLAGFPGSVLLTQDSPGHTSLTTTSLCTLGFFRQYLLNGTLPKPGTVCPVQATLFGAPEITAANSTASRSLSSDSDSEEMLAALKAIGDAIRPALTAVQWKYV